MTTGLEARRSGAAGRHRTGQYVTFRQEVTMVTEAIVVASQLAGLGAAGVSVGAAVSARRRQRPYAPGAFVESVSERVDPVGAALRYGCAGVAVRLHVGRDAKRPAEGELRGPAG